MDDHSLTYRYFFAKALNLALVVCVLAAFSAWAAKANAHDAAVQEQIAAAERAASRGPYAQDGVFTGSAQGFGGPVKMQVSIENGYISDVQILDASAEDDAWLEMCQGLPEQIVKAQGTSVDVVSGATYTSSGILNGATQALKQAAGGN